MQYNRSFDPGITVPSVAGRIDHTMWLNRDADPPESEYNSAQTRPAPGGGGEGADYAWIDEDARNNAAAAAGVAGGGADYAWIDEDARNTAAAAAGVAGGGADYAWIDEDARNNATAAAGVAGGGAAPDDDGYSRPVSEYDTVPNAAVTSSSSSSSSSGGGGGGRLPSHTNYSGYDVVAASTGGSGNIVYATYASLGGASNSTSPYYDAQPVPSEQSYAEPLSEV